MAGLCECARCQVKEVISCGDRLLRLRRHFGTQFCISALPPALRMPCTRRGYVLRRVSYKVSERRRQGTYAELRTKVPPQSKEPVATRQTCTHFSPPCRSQCRMKPAKYAQALRVLQPASRTGIDSLRHQRRFWEDTTNRTGCRVQKTDESPERLLYSDPPAPAGFRPLCYTLRHVPHHPPDRCRPRL
jgi:hypothetical protein